MSFTPVVNKQHSLLLTQQSHIKYNVLLLPSVACFDTVGCGYNVLLLSQ